MKTVSKISVNRIHLLLINGLSQLDARVRLESLDSRQVSQDKLVLTRALIVIVTVSKSE